MPASRFSDLSVFLSAILLTSSLPSAQTTYRWIDKASRRTVYSDHPPPPGTAQVVKMGGGNGGIDESSISYPTRQAMQKYPVTLYSSVNCIDECKQARDFLNGRGVPFSEKLMTTQDEIGELANKLGGEAAIPSLFVGQQSFKGFEPLSWNNLLDLAGYPKSVAYGSKLSGVFAQ